mmetsp:Transcript_4051/g.9590  ORF Transcript_4051/g.9590 Transcript_4051/m.9590 type:complete len:623 (+) Transcript_4051:91-1959(+)
MEATVRLSEGDANVAVQVFWKGHELNLLRPREEPISRFLQRLGLSCGKIMGRQGGGGAKKKAKKEKRAVVTDGGGEGADTVEDHSSLPPPPKLLTESGESLPSDTSLEKALEVAKHLEIEGDRMPLVVNPPSITKIEVFGKPLVDCPLTANLRCEFCRPEDFDLRWLRQTAAGQAPTEGDLVKEGRILWVPKESLGSVLSLRADAKGAELTGRPRGLVKVGLVETVPEGFPETRLKAFGPRRGGKSIRTVTFNILAVCYARTQMATRDLYPYCPPPMLDITYRQPLIGRELYRLDGDVVLLQEVAYAFFHKCLVPLFGGTYHMRISLKASKVSEGCAMLLRREAFEVLSEHEALFRNAFRHAPAHRQNLREVCSKWPEFLNGILPKMTTVFQVSAARHIETGRVLVIANTHLFFHPLAKHLRLLQLSVLLQEVHEMREKHRGPNGELPDVIFGGDLNCGPGSGAGDLLTKGAVSSEHPDWDCSTQFGWRAGHDNDGAEDEACEADTEGDRPTSKSSSNSPFESLPKSSWQPGKGVALQSPVGKMVDSYEGTGLQFTNYVNGFSGTLDWILHAGGLKVQGTLPGVSEEELRPLVGLPNELHPSDHLSMAADLEILPLSGQSQL